MKQQKPWAKYSLLILLLLVPSLIFYFFVFTGVQHISRLPFYGPREIVQTQRRGKTMNDTVYHQIPAFSLSTPEGASVDTSRVNGRIYIASFLDFGVLDKIPDQVVFVASEILKEHPDVLVITYFRHYRGQHLPKPSSITPVLAQRDTSWIYLTQTDTAIESLFTNGYFAPDPELRTPKDPHSIALIDKEGHIRGYYSPVLADDVKKLKEEITHLKREYGLNFRTHKYYQYDDKPVQKRDG